MAGFLDKLKHRMENVRVLGLANAWFIFQKRCKDKRECVNTVSPTEKEQEKILKDSRRRKRRLLSYCVRKRRTAKGSGRRFQQLLDRFTGNSSCTK